MFKKLFFTRDFQEAANDAVENGTPLYESPDGYIAASKGTRSLIGIDDGSLEFVPLDREGPGGEWPCRDTTDDR